MERPVDRVIRLGNFTLSLFLFFFFPLSVCYIFPAGHLGLSFFSSY